MLRPAAPAATRLPMETPRVPLLALALWGLAACSTPPRVEPPAPEIGVQLSTRTLALTPVDAGSWSEGRGDSWDHVDRALAEGVGARGWVLAPRDPTARLAEAHLERPNPGPQPGQLASASHDPRSDLRGSLALHLGVGGVVFAEVVLRSARFEDGIASWDGARQPIQAADRMRDRRIRRSGYSGHVPAFSLHVRVEDVAGRLVYQGWGGIELCQILRGGRWYDLPDAELLMDAERLAAAARTALAGLPAAP